MKLFSLLCALFCITLVPSPVHAQDAGGNSIDTLHAKITKTPFTYVRGVYTLAIKFKGNGTGDCNGVKFKWRSKDAQTIEMTKLSASGEPTDQKTTITFSQDYASFTGTDFDGVTKVTGKLTGQ